MVYSSFLYWFEGWFIGCYYCYTHIPADTLVARIHSSPGDQFIEDSPALPSQETNVSEAKKHGRKESFLEGAHPKKPSNSHGKSIRFVPYQSISCFLSVLQPTKECGCISKCARLKRPMCANSILEIVGGKGINKKNAYKTCGMSYWYVSHPEWYGSYSPKGKQQQQQQQQQQQ